MLVLESVVNTFTYFQFLFVNFVNNVLNRSLGHSLDPTHVVEILESGGPSARETKASYQSPQRREDKGGKM